VWNIISTTPISQSSEDAFIF